MLLSTGKDVFLDFTIKIVETSLALMRRKSQETAQAPITKHVFIFDLGKTSEKIKSKKQDFGHFSLNPYPPTINRDILISADIFQHTDLQLCDWLISSLLTML